ncbi:uncharacterized protein LOC144354727 [Saccoglossus kowalevskii]
MVEANVPIRTESLNEKTKSLNVETPCRSCIYEGSSYGPELKYKIVRIEEQREGIEPVYAVAPGEVCSDDTATGSADTDVYYQSVVERTPNVSYKEDLCHGKSFTHSDEVSLDLHSDVLTSVDLADNSGEHGYTTRQCLQNNSLPPKSSYDVPGKDGSICSELSTEDLDDISSKIGSECKRLLRRLGVPDDTIERISAENRDTYELTYQGLLYWKRNTPASREKLYTALNIIGRNDILNYLSQKYIALSTK